MCHEAFHSRLPRRTPHMACRRLSHQPRASPEPAELHRRRTDAPVHAGHEVGTPFDGDCDLAGGWCSNPLDIPIEPLGPVDRRQRSVCDVFAGAHRHLEQIARVVSPDISADDYSGGARGGAAATAPEPGPQRGLLRTAIKLHCRVSKIEPAAAAPRGPRVHTPGCESDSGIGNVTPNAGALAEGKLLLAQPSWRRTSSPATNRC